MLLFLFKSQFISSDRFFTLFNDVFEETVLTTPFCYRVLLDHLELTSTISILFSQSGENSSGVAKDITQLFSSADLHVLLTISQREVSVSEALF